MYIAKRHTHYGVVFTQVSKVIFCHSALVVFYIYRALRDWLNKLATLGHLSSKEEKPKLFMTCLFLDNLIISTWLIMWMRNYQDPSNLLRSLMYCSQCQRLHTRTICKKFSIGESGRWPFPRTSSWCRNQPQDFLISPIILSNVWQSAAFPYIKEARKAIKL